MATNLEATLKTSGLRKHSSYPVRSVRRQQCPLRTTQICLPPGFAAASNVRNDGPRRSIGVGGRCPQRAVHVGRGEIVWQDRCDASNGSKEPKVAMFIGSLCKNRKLILDIPSRNALSGERSDVLGRGTTATAKVGNPKFLVQRQYVSTKCIRCFSINL